MSVCCNLRQLLDDMLSMNSSMGCRRGGFCTFNYAAAVCSPEQVVLIMTAGMQDKAISESCKLGRSMVFAPIGGHFLEHKFLIRSTG